MTLGCCTGSEFDDGEVGEPAARSRGALRRLQVALGIDLLGSVWADGEVPEGTSLKGAGRKSVHVDGDGEPGDLVELGWGAVGEVDLSLPETDKERVGVFRVVGVRAGAGGQGELVVGGIEHGSTDWRGRSLYPPAQR